MRATAISWDGYNNDEALTTIQHRAATLRDGYGNIARIETFSTTRAIPSDGYDKMPLRTASLPCHDTGHPLGWLRKRTNIVGQD
jgi:hypothetical protein